DFATQVHFWTLYREQCDLLGIPYGKHVERDAFCREVISARVEENHFHNKKIPCFED
ncbi:unnamed protein product, partial [Durusdinium trenchii]